MLNNLSWRQELKFAVPQKLTPTILKLLEENYEPDQNQLDGNYIVQSLYFDNLQRDSLKAKLSGNLTRWKVRLRFYNGSLDKAVSEIKWRHGAHIAKDQVRGEGKDLFNKICSGYWQDHQTGTKVTLAGRLFPRILISYRRRAFFFGSGMARVTIDDNIRAKLVDSYPVNLKADWGQELCRGINLMEVKFNEAIPTSVCISLNQFPVRRVTFSKYAEGMLKHLQHQAEDSALTGYFSR